MLTDRCSRSLFTACATAMFILGAESPHGAQSRGASSSAREAYRRAIEKVDALRQIQASLADRADAQGAVIEQAKEARSAIETSSRDLKVAVDSVKTMSACMGTVSRAIQESTQLADEYLRSARESLTRTSEFSRAASADAAARLAASGTVFAQRSARKQALLDRVADVKSSKAACSGQVSATHGDVGGAASAFDDVITSTRTLASSVELLERQTNEIVALAQVARSRGWLQVDVSAAAFPPGLVFDQLRERVDALDGAARLQLHDPHPKAAAQLSDYHDAVLRLAIEQDAHRFLALLAESATADCTADECVDLLDRVEDQEQEARKARQEADEERSNVERTIAASPGLGIFSRDPAAWIEAQVATEKAFAAANTQVNAIVEAATRISARLDGPVAKALKAAVDERGAAYRRAFGEPEPEPRTGAAAPVTPGPDNAQSAPSSAVGAGMFLKRHAFEVLALRSKEAADYGAYTYVIFPRREKRPEYAALLEAIVALTPAAEPDAAKDIKNVTNLFEIPGKSAAPIAVADTPDYARDIDNYDSQRALSLLQTASDGVLTAPKALRQFQRSPGPFLLTVPVPLDQARGVTQLLLADLNGYPPEGFQDLVKSYQNQLIAAFPTTQTVWYPPWNQRLALGLMSLGVMATGQNFVALRR